MSQRDPWISTVSITLSICDSTFRHKQEVFSFYGRIISNEVTFTSEAHVETIRGFHDCGSLDRLDIPAAVKGIGAGELIRELRFASGTQVEKQRFASLLHFLNGYRII
jgi:hypothetical protein